MYHVPGMAPVLDVIMLMMMAMASLISFASWRSPHTRGGVQADVIRGIKSAAWAVLGCWYTFRFIENDFDLKVTAITGLGFFLLTFADILCGLIAMNRIKDVQDVADHQASRGPLVHHRLP